VQVRQGWERAEREADKPTLSAHGCSKGVLPRPGGACATWQAVQAICANRVQCGSLAGSGPAGKNAGGASTLTPAPLFAHGPHVPAEGWAEWREQHAACAEAGGQHELRVAQVGHASVKAGGPEKKMEKGKTTRAVKAPPT